MNNQNLFNQSYNQIVKEVVGEGNKYFQMLASPMSFNWPVAPTGQLSPEAYMLMSAAPSYSAMADFTSSSSKFFDNYKQIFAHIGYEMSDELKNQIQSLSNDSMDAKNDVSKLYSAMNSAYNADKQNMGAMFDAKFPNGISDWIKGPGASYEDDIKTAQDKVEKINKNIRALNQANMPSDVQEAMDIIEKPSGKPSAGDTKDGWTIVPDGAGILRWRPAFSISTTSQDFRTQLANGSIGSKTITLDASKSDSKIEKNWAGGNASYGNPFWGVNVGGSWERTDITQSDSSVTATIHLESSTTVMIEPGAWYNGGLLKGLATAGNDGSGYQILSPYTATGGNHPLFGADGICSTMVTGLVVAYKPKFSVEMDSSTYKSFEEKITASTGFRIGPFGFGGSGGHYEKEVNTTGNRTTFTGGSESDDPVILGVTLGFPGTNKP